MPTRFRTAALSILALALASSYSASAQSVPHTELTTLTGQAVTFPKPGSEKPLLLVLSFSHESTADLANWNKYFKAPYVTDHRVDFYELADFEGIPSFVLKMILHGMRRSVKEPERSHLAPFYSGESKWKGLVKFDNAQVCYLVLSAAKGDVVWQTAGPASSKSAEELELALSKLIDGH